MDAWSKKAKATARRRALRAHAIQIMGGSCRICGYNACESAMDFHHLDDFEKEFTISDKMTSWDAIERELLKCVLLCSRCHREVHDGMHVGFLQLDERSGDMYLD